MAPIEEYTDDEILEIMYKVGDIILGVECGEKMLPEKTKTAWLALQMAHSMIGDLYPEESL
mgnify:FL=1